MISDDLLAFRTGGKSLVVGTRDKDLVPECARRGHFLRPGPAARARYRLIR